MRSRLFLLVGVLSLLGSAGASFGAAFAVGATSNIFLSGLNAPLGTGIEPGGGLLPIEVSVVGGSTLTFSNILISSFPAYLACNVAKLDQVSYQVTSTDGGTCGTSTMTDITGTGTGISGIVAPATMFLTGVFLTDSAPSGSDPATLDFTSIGTNFASLAPGVGQTFFIGDGMTGTGSGALQQFVVPAGATRLFLGFADAYDGIAFHGPNNYYGDNFGSVNGTVDSSLAPVPEPTTMALVGLGLCAAGFLRRRRAN
jgi:hypothetical protein